MLLTLPIELFDIDQVVIYCPTCNSMTTSIFSKCAYRTANITCHGIYLYVTPSYYHYLHIIECAILSKYASLQEHSVSNKTPYIRMHLYKLKCTTNYVFYISGIWENATSYGISFRIYPITE